MEAKELLVVFEKMYLQESEIKEKVTIRIQIVFTLLLAIVTVLSYMLRMLDLDRSFGGVVLIVASSVVLLVFLGMASNLAVRAFWGNTFKLMPSASEIKEYHKELNEYNEGVRSAEARGDFQYALIDVRAEIELYLSDLYEECATHNAIVNMERSRKVHESFRWLLLSFVPLGIAGVMFVAYDMDVSSPRKNFQVIDSYVGGQLSRIEKRLELISREKK